MSSSMPPAYQQPSQPEPSKATGEPPIWAPWYGIGFMAAVKRPFLKYADFSGRASRGEYWFFYLAYVIVFAVLYAVFGIIAGVMAAGAVTDQATTGAATVPPGLTAVTIIFQVVIGLIGLALLLPYLALTWRRLHDANYPGPYFFLGLIPLVGPILLIVYLATGSRAEGQRFDQPR